ncbi:undecaprenyl-diphosphatase [bacterium BMS3Abin01]|nr:undecaprenyl-diphosphatase [bacterium BMS3Abin01]HDY69820.1 undecaprenyl-diphosphatase UppP [Actinomycetota bacterium]
MTVLQAIILGVVQGVTEFLPISSSGHLVIIPYLLGWEVPSTSFDVMLHLGTVTAVVGYFWRDLAEIATAFLRTGGEAQAGRRVGFLVAVGTVPAVIAGYFLESTFEKFFLNPPAVAGFLLITGLLLIGTGVLIEVGEDVGSKRRGLGRMKIRDAVYIGMMQALAIAPGISRSGTTISMGLFLGLKRETAARYSFLLSIPVIAGAAVLKMRHGIGGSGVSNPALIAGFLAAALSGFAAVWFLMNFIRRHSLRVFAYYCWVVGAGVLALHFFR